MFLITMFVEASDLKQIVKEMDEIRTIVGENSVLFQALKEGIATAEDLENETPIQNPDGDGPRYPGSTQEDL